MDKLFGTDGIRGLANVYPMDSETMLKLGRASAHVFRRNKGRHRILIGKDTRISGYMLETALASGISSMGVDVLLVGPLPTPGIAFMIRSMRADAGVMISASHNSYEDNGIKFFGADGFKLADNTENEIERLMTDAYLNELRASPELIGKASRIDDAIGRYTVYLKTCIEKECKLDGLKIVIDCANGAAYKVAPLVFSELGASVFTVNNQPDGKNINDNCGSLHPESMQKLVKEHGADCGIAFDGDADRLIMCDENGKLLDGDILLAISALDFDKRGLLKKRAIVGTVMTNFGLEQSLASAGIKLYRSDVGDRYVLAKMLEEGINIGGEQSGHLIFLDHNTTGDGIVSALITLSIMLRNQKPLSAYHSLLQRYPQQMININVHSKLPFEDIPLIKQSIIDVESRLGDKGRVLLRYSGTEKKARVMVECEDDALCKSASQELANVVQKELGI